MVQVLNPDSAHPEPALHRTALEWYNEFEKKEGGELTDVLNEISEWEVESFGKNSFKKLR